MNTFEFVLAIIVITGIFSLVRHRLGIRSNCGSDLSQKSEENERLRDQVKQMQDRIRVLERIVTDSGVQTASQIEALRERDRFVEEDQA